MIAGRQHARRRFVTMPKASVRGVGGRHDGRVEMSSTRCAYRGFAIARRTRFAKVRAMNMKPPPLVDIDWSTFEPMRAQSLRHDLSSHPMLETEQLVELGKRFRGTRHWFAFNNDARADANFDNVDALFPCRQAFVDALRSISDAKAWVLLRHIQVDPLYRTMVDSVLDSIKPEIEARDPGMFYRAGWIFAASPNTVTPFHIDRDHVVLLQIRGAKTIYVWDCDDKRVVSDRARDRFHRSHDLTLVQWNEAFRKRAHLFELRPGTGVYIPQSSAHMVETSNDASITISFSYSTRTTHQRAMLHMVRDLMFRAGIEPPAVGTHRVFDRMTCAFGSAMVAMGGPGSRPPACPSLRRRYPYAIPD